MILRSSLLLALVLGPVLACSAATGEDEATSGSAIQTTNGREPNGREPNGREPNGREPNGNFVGVWHTLRSGAKVMDPLASSSGTMRTAGMGAAGAALGTLTPLSTVRLEAGELIGVRSSGALVRGTGFKDVYLVGRGPTPPAPVVPPRGGILVGRLGTVGTALATATSMAPATGATAATPVTGAISNADAIRAYVAKRLAATDVPERDVELRVTAAFARSQANDFHGYQAKSRWHYQVEVKEADGVWRGFCPANADGSVGLAIAVPDRFNFKQGLNRTVTTRDHRGGAVTTTTRVERGGGFEADATAFTLACDHAVITKCVERLGYDPEKTIGQIKPDAPSFAQGKPARDLLSSCVRMFRADYCGNGISMTLDGTEIDVYDSSHVVEPATTTSTWPMEASWRPDGATCGQQERQACVPAGDGTLARVSVKDYVQTICPNTIDRVETSDDAACESSHYFPGFDPPPPWNGGGGVPGTPGTPHLAFGGTLQVQRDNPGGTPGVQFDEWDVIWTKTQFTHTNGCANARPLSDILVATGATIAR